MTTNRTPDLADDRRAELATRIDALQGDAEKITTERGQTALGHYRAHQSDFEGKQQLIGAEIDKAPDAGRAALENAKEAQGHEYAAFLAGRLEDFHTRDSSADGHNAAQYYGGLRSQHTETAALLRGGEPEKPTDPTPPKGRADEAGSFEPAPGSKYDALRQSEEAAKALIAAQSQPTKQPEPDEDEKRKAGGGPAVAGDPTRPQHIRLVAAAEPTPHGTSSTRSTFFDPNENPDLPAYKEALGDPRPIHPDDHTPPPGGGAAAKEANAPEIGGYVLFEHHLQGGQISETNAYLFTDRAGAIETARNYPFSQAEALRSGDQAFAEIHPVTAGFAAHFEDMQKGGRLEDVAALYSTAQEINGHLAAAHPDEPGAIKGAYHEAEDGRASQQQADESVKRQEGERAAQAGEPTQEALPKTYEEFLAARAATYRDAPEAAQEAEPMTEQSRPALGGRGD